MALTLAITAEPESAQAASNKTFTTRYSVNANGAVLTIGNSLLTCSTTGSSGTYCSRTHDGGVYDNNNFAMMNLDADGETATFNSSSSDLSLPEGAKIEFVGLYWGARLAAGSDGRAGSSVDADKMAIKTPGATAYQTVKGQILAQNDSSYGAYQSFYDATALVKAAGNGTYWGANVQAGTGWDRYAGWALTVVYTAPGLPLRNLTVFDGFDTVSSGAPQDISISGFVAPMDGTVDTQLSMVAYEGDLAQTGDYTELNRTQLATAAEPGSNFFNSANSLAGNNVTSRNPAYRNMLGFDIKNLAASGVIPAGAQSATFSFSSAGDVYYPGVLALAINLYAPDFTASTKTVTNVTHPGKLANPGDILQYTLMFANTGQDPAVGVSSCDVLPDKVDYILGSLTLLNTADDLVITPVTLPDDGASFAKYDSATHAVCINLGRSAGPYNTPGGGGTFNVLDATYYQFRVKIQDGAGGTTLSNAADLYYTTGTTHIAATYSTPPVTTEVGLKADVKIVKDMTPVEAIAGQAGVTKLTITNDGPNLATGVVVSDPLPSLYRAGSISWTAGPPLSQTGTCALPPGPGGTVSCTLPDMPSGQVIEISVAGAPDAASTDPTLSNMASVTTSSFDPDLSNNVDTVSIPMTHQADLKISKTLNTAAAIPGASLDWTVTVTNQCNATSPTDPSGCLSDALGVVISDLVPDPSKLVLTSLSGGNGSGGGQGDVTVDCPASVAGAASVQCTVASDGRLRPGQTAVVRVQGYLAANVTAGPVLNTASVSSTTFDPNQADNIDTNTINPAGPVSDIQLAKTGPGGAKAIPGGRVSFTITAENFGPSDAAAVRISDDLATAGLIVDGSTTVSSDRGTCFFTGSVATCNLGTLPGPSSPGGTGAKATVTIAGALTDPARTGSFTNTTTMTCAGTACDEGSTPHPDTPTTSVDLTPEADLSVTKRSVTSHIPSPLDPVSYEITLNNAGPSNAVAVHLADTLPDGMTATSISLTTGSGTCSLASLTCDFGTWAPGDGAVVTVVGTVDAAGLSTYQQQASVSAATPDPVPANNTAIWEHTGSAQADLALAKTSSGLGAGRSGDQYTLTVTNLGPDGAVDPVIVDNLPPGLTIGSLPSECAVTATQQVTCSKGSPLAASDTWQIVIPVSLPTSTDAGTTLTNSASVTSPTGDPTRVNNTATVVETTTAETDLVITYAIGYDVDGSGNLITTPAPGAYTGAGSIRYAQIRVVNNGPATAKNTQVLSNVAISALVEPTRMPTYCDAVNLQLVCQLPGGLAPGAEWAFDLQMYIAPATPAAAYVDCGRDVTCTAWGGWASTSTSTPESVLTNNYDTAALTVTDPKTDLRITKTALSTGPNPNGDGHDSYVAGAKFGYQIALWVPAGLSIGQRVLAADAADVVLRDTLPSGFSTTQVNTDLGTCDPVSPGDTSIHCDLGTVAANTDPNQPHKATVYVYGSIDHAVEAEIGDGSGATNTATATSPVAPIDVVLASSSLVTATATTDVFRQADLQTAKLADAPLSYAGTTAGYTVTTINNGPSDADNTVITDTLPLGLTLNTTSSPGCSVVGLTGAGEQIVECLPQVAGQVVGLIPANQSTNTRIVADIDPQDIRPYWCTGQDNVNGVDCPEVLPPDNFHSIYPRQITNQVRARSDAVDSNSTNNDATAVTSIDFLADIAVDAAVSTTTPSAGGRIVYTMSGVNLGPSALDNPVVVSTFPPGFQVVDVIEPVMNCVTTSVGSGLSAVYTVTCTGWKVTPIRDSFQPGITVPGSVVVDIPPSMPSGQYTATAQAYSKNTWQCPDARAGTCESNYNNNDAAVTVAVTQTADTSITKTLRGPNPIVAGQTVTYELTAKNDGPSVAENVTIADTVPDGMTYVSGSVKDGEACPSPEQIDEQNIIKCPAGSIAPGDTKTVELVFLVDLHYKGEMCNSALIGSGALDPEAGNNTGSACALSIPSPPSDVAVSVTPDSANIEAGGRVGYSAVVVNNGPNPVTGAKVTFTIPPNLTDVTVVVSGKTGQVVPGGCSLSGQTHTCQIGDLFVGDTVTYRITGTASRKGPFDLTLRAATAHDGADALPSNDSASAVIHVGPMPPTGFGPLGPLAAAVILVLVGFGLVRYRRGRQSQPGQQGR
jgi:uncharacterized repeat protein (TIGR01451 family)